MNELRYYVMFAIYCQITAYPLGKLKPVNETEIRDEKQYPNGTIVGKYTYKDREGNPVHVKYFADDSSYGVELKSFNIINSNYPVVPQDKHSKTDFSFKTEIDPDTLKNNLQINKGFPLLLGDKNLPKPHSDFEIFMENDPKTEKYGNEKVRVYYDKSNKRKIRNVFNPHETFQFCKQF